MKNNPTESDVYHTWMIYVAIVINQINSGFLVMDEIQNIINGLHCSFKPEEVTVLFLYIQLH